MSNNENSDKNLSSIEKFENWFLSLQKIKLKQKLIFYRLLSTMINSGMGLVKSVSILEHQEKDILMKKILVRFGEELKSGKSLSECLELYPSSFEDAEVGIVKSGEKTGKLNMVLVDLADQIEKVSSISGKIKGALMYPAFIMVVVIGVVAVMMTMVVPKLLDIFDDKSDLPATTKALISISEVFQNYWWLMVMIIIFLYLFVIIWRKTPNGRYLLDSYMLKAPVFGQISRKLILSKFSRIFSGLIGSGISIVESLNITSEAVGNDVYRQRILLLAEDVKQGIKIHESLDQDKLFPEMMVQMIQVGEQTAKLDKTILKIADFYDEEVDNTIGVINKLLEPFIIVFLAVVVGFIAVGIMQPIMNLADTISSK